MVRPEPRPVCLAVLLALVIVGGSYGSGRPGEITLLSAVAHRKGDANSVSPFPTADGGRVVFWSDADNLSPLDTDEVPDVYVKYATGQLVLASTSDGGVKGLGQSSDASISADGRKVAFLSYAANLDPADTDAIPDIYVKDLTSADLTLVSTTAAGVKGNADSLYPALSPDGTRVAFVTYSTNFDRRDTDGASDVYVKDLVTGALTLVSTSEQGAKGDLDSAWPVLSWNGTTVAFWSEATDLDPADTDTIPDVFVKDLHTGAVTVASTSSGGTKGNGTSLFPSLAWDATKVAFWSQATNLDQADQDAVPDAYVKDLVTGTLSLVSTSTGGIKGNSVSDFPRISGDGTVVAFESLATNLDPADADAKWDIYAKSLLTGVLTLMSTSNRGAKGNGSSLAPALTYDGVGVTFSSTATNLDRHDRDTVLDTYFKSVPQA